MFYKLLGIPDCFVYACIPYQFLDEIFKIIWSIGNTFILWTYEIWMPVYVNERNGAVFDLCGSRANWEVSNSTESQYNAGIGIVFADGVNGMGVCGSRPKKPIKNAGIGAVFVGADQRSQ